MNTATQMQPATNPYKSKRVAWKTFDTLLTCFRNDPRVFQVKDVNVKGFNHPMRMSNIITFWDGGIEDKDTMQQMLDILLVASSMSIGETRECAGWIMKRTA